MKLTALLMALALPASSWALDLAFAGYLGNSGSTERPITISVDPSKPVWEFARHVTERGNPYADICIGPAYDENAGLIYATAGFNTINAYALDGRVVASYKLPKQYNLTFWNRPRLMRAGKYILIYGGDRNDKRLYKLAFGAPDGTVASVVESAGKESTGISISARDGKALIKKTDGKLYTFDPETDAFEHYADKGDLDIATYDWTPDGNIVYKTPQGYAGFIRVAGGKSTVETTQNKIGGDGWTITDGYLWSCGGGTINRYAFPSLAVDPGVVFGGASGSFLGYVVMNREMDASYGIVKLKDNLFALTSGQSQVIHLAEWDETKKKFTMVRRIGAIPRVRSLFVDSAGNVLINKFVWSWDDGSLSPVRDNYDNGYLYESVDRVLNFGLAYDHKDKRSVFLSRVSTLKRCRDQKQTWKKEYAVLKNPVGAASYRDGRDTYAVLIDTAGRALSYKVGNDGTLQTEKELKMKLKSSGSGFSDLATVDDQNMLAMIDGSLVTLQVKGDKLEEQSRWRDDFEAGAMLDVDGDRVVITEKGKNLLSIYSLKTKKLIAKQEVQTPTKVNINGSRLVVFEQEKQRVVKYNLVD